MLERKRQTQQQRKLQNQQDQNIIEYITVVIWILIKRDRYLYRKQLVNTSSVLIAGNSEQIEPLFERIDNIILKCYHLNIRGVLPVAMIPRNNLRYKNTANLPGLAVFLCAVFSSIISYIIAC